MRYLLHFLWKNYALLLFLVLELISLVFVVNGNKHQSSVFSSVANQYGGEIFTSYSNARNYFHLKNANEQLSIENAYLKKQLLNYQFKLDSNNFQSFAAIDTTKLILSDTIKPIFDFIPAKVISNTTNRQKNYIMFNKGLKHGVHKNMGVIGPNGIVGVIFECSDDFSTAVSLLNIKQSISAKLKNNNELGSIIWDGISPLYGKLDAIENYVPVNIGDTIITSGFSHIFPEGENIGIVEDFSKISGKTSWNIKVRFNTNFSQLFWVNIARNLNYEQQMTLKAIKLEN
ncbi:MAG: rod shape-determining protein MreC [Bacteroidetes bacterium]|nr:MAG: rod shape-determining protein MreC [Bacteroidota bacterium]